MTKNPHQVNWEKGTGMLRGASGIAAGTVMWMVSNQVGVSPDNQLQVVALYGTGAAIAAAGTVSFTASLWRLYRASLRTVRHFGRAEAVAAVVPVRAVAEWAPVADRYRTIVVEPGSHSGESSHSLAEAV